MNVQTHDTHLDTAVAGGRVTASLVRFYEDDRGMPEGTEAVHLDLDPKDALAMGVSLILASMAAGGRPVVLNMEGMTHGV